MFDWEDVDRQMNQKSEDLPEFEYLFLLPRGLGSQGAIMIWSVGVASLYFSSLCPQLLYGSWGFFCDGWCFTG